MTKTVSDMSVYEAASKALELVIYGAYVEDKNGKYAYREPLSGSFEEYFTENYGDEDFYDSEEGEFVPLSLDNLAGNNSVWQELKWAGKQGSRDGLTGEVVAEYGGEGQGDDYWMVISLSDGNVTRFFRKDGYYASYDGGTLDGEIQEVNPVERIVTFYE